MKKLITVLFLSCLCFLLKAQMPNGSIAPDWTLTDINNQSHTLYNYLDSGYVVFLSFNGTWTPPGWTYHQSNALQDLYNLYGPGTADNRVRVFFIEGDATTNSADLNGTGSNTQGDWITGTPYPIIDDASITSPYQIGYWPTIYQICPNRTITEVGQAATGTLWTSAQAANCTPAIFPVDVAIIEYSGNENTCDGLFTPKISIMNFGLNNLTSATINVKDGNTTLLSQNWTGNLPKYGFDTVSLNQIIINSNSFLTFEIVTPNDSNSTNNTIYQDISVAPFVSEDTLFLEIQTDNYGYETYWAIIDDNNIIYAEGGNTLVGLNGGGAQVAGTGNFGAYASNTLIQETVILQGGGGGCFKFVIVDDWGDGMCCSFGNGYYNLYDQNYSLIKTGGLFDTQEEGLLKKGAPDTTDIEILSYTGNNLPCDNNFNTSVLITNNGPHILNNAIITLSYGTNVIYSHSWTGILLSGDTASINIGTIPIASSGTYTLSVSSPTDFNLSNNQITKQLTISPSSAFNQFAVNIQTDTAGYETYWAILDDLGNLIVDGGNTNVGLNGGGLQIATSADSGVYPNSSLVIDTVFLPAAGCYSLHLVDDGGNGIANTIVLKEVLGNTLITTSTFTNNTIEQFNIDQSLLAIDGELVSFDANVYQCGDKFPIAVSITNNGYFDIDSFTLIVRENINVLQTFSWAGTLSTFDTIQIVLDSITLSNSTLIGFDIQVIGDNDFSNNFLPQYITVAPASSRDSFTLELATDNKGHEIYWAVTDEQGNIVVDGGNTNVGLNGGGLQISSSSDPGAYTNNTIISSTIAVPLDGCYQFHVVDDGGDGFCCSGTAYNYSLIDNHNTLLSGGTLIGADTANYFTTYTAVGTHEMSSIEQLKLFPNPTSQFINIQFSIVRPSATSITITNALGATVKSYEPRMFNTGFYNEELNINDLTSGIYYLSMNNGEQVVSRKFVVIK